MNRLLKSSACMAGGLFLSLVVAAPAAAQQVASTGGQGQDEGQKVVCKRAMQTGTRMKTKKCATKQDWARVEEAAKKGAKEMFDRPVIETRRD